MAFSRSFSKLCGTVTGHVIEHSITTMQERFCVIIDAGSTGSRVHIYRYVKSAEDRLPVVQQQGKGLKNKVALSRFLANPGRAGASLLPLINYAQEQVGLVIKQILMH